MFQSTRPRRARPVYGTDNAKWAVSIHAPTQGATRRVSTRGRYRGFNPRAHAGRDAYDTLVYLGVVVSIHAPTQGATTSFPKRGVKSLVSIHAPTQGATLAIVPIKTHYCFNPRAHAGRDKSAYFNANKWIVSIHAPTQGATRVCGRDLKLSLVSIHAPTQGATITE